MTYDVLIKPSKTDQFGRKQGWTGYATRYQARKAAKKAKESGFYATRIVESGSKHAE